MREDTRNKSAAGPRKKRRRKHSRSHKPKDKQPQHGSQLALSTSSSLDKSNIDAKDVHAPLSPDEVTEMKEHLQFLLKHRKTLQLKINAKEDLLINGSREPSERGVCMHLLRKVDKSCVEKALRRTPDAQTRTQLLQGIVRFSSDAGLLILYLESLRETESRSQAAAALSLGLKRIDFDKASKAQMSRVLDLIQSLFPKESLPQLLFGFLQNDSFRKAFDHSADRLPPELSEIFIPIRTLFASIIEGEIPKDKAVLRKGLSLYWGSSHHALKEAPESTKRRLFELETALSENPAETDRALQIVLDSIRVNERLYSTLGMSWVRELLGRHEDKKAEEVLTGLAKHHPRFELPRKWLGALKQDRMGRIAVKPPKDETATLQRGFWLDCQRDVLVRIGPVDQREHFEKQARLHQSLHVSGVAPFAISGTTKEGMPYIATDFYGKSATALYQKRPPIHLVIDHLEEGIRLLWSLGKAGVSVAEFGVKWCFVDSNNRLWLQDLSQCELCPPESAFMQNLTTAKQWCETQLELIGPRKRPLFAKDSLQNAEDFQTLMQWCRLLG